MGFNAVSDTGPILHIHEIGAPDLWKIAKTVTTTDVEAELRKYNFKNILPIKITNKEKTNYYTIKYDLGIGESSCIALCAELSIKTLFTDDLAARSAAKKEGLDPHGTIGIILRAYRDKIITKKQTIEHLVNLKQKSSLFITNQLIEMAIQAVNKKN